MSVDVGRFMKELLRDQGLSVGRYDGRYTGVEEEGVGEYTWDDPSGYAMDSAFTGAMNDYMTRFLNIDIPRPYEVLSFGPGSKWKSVSGGGSGIGAATARAFSKQGCEVAILDCNAKAVQTVSNEIGCLGLVCDVTSIKSVNNEPIDFREHKLGDGVKLAKKKIRDFVDFLDIDRPLYDDHNTMKNLVKKGDILEKVEFKLGNLYEVKI